MDFLHFLFWLLHFYQKFYVFIVRPFLIDPADHNTDPYFPIPSNFRQSTVEPQYNKLIKSN